MKGAHDSNETPVWVKKFVDRKGLPPVEQLWAIPEEVRKSQDARFCSEKS
jgi:hypothetical protein